MEKQYCRSSLPCKEECLNSISDTYFRLHSNQDSEDENYSIEDENYSTYHGERVLLNVSVFKKEKKEVIICHIGNKNFHKGRLVNRLRRDYSAAFCIAMENLRYQCNSCGSNSECPC